MTRGLEGSILPFSPFSQSIIFMGSPFARHKFHKFLLLQARAFQPILIQLALPQPYPSVGMSMIGSLVVSERGDYYPVRNRNRKGIQSLKREKIAVPITETGSTSVIYRHHVFLSSRSCCRNAPATVETLHKMSALFLHNLF